MAATNENPFSLRPTMTLNVMASCISTLYNLVTGIIFLFLLTIAVKALRPSATALCRVVKAGPTPFPLNVAVRVLSSGRSSTRRNVVKGSPFSLLLTSAVRLHSTCSRPIRRVVSVLLTRALTTISTCSSALSRHVTKGSSPISLTRLILALTLLSTYSRAIRRVVIFLLTRALTTISTCSSTPSCQVTKGSSPISLTLLTLALSLLFPCFPLVALGAAVNPLTSLDILETYPLHTAEQCSRLCWYRKGCRGHSFYHSTTMLNSVSVPTAEDNCVLHENEALPAGDVNAAGWTRGPASLGQLTNGCAARPCQLDEACVPMGRDPGYWCVKVTHIAAATRTCPLDITVTGGNVTYSGRRPGGTATVLCHFPRYEWKPENSSTTHTCQADYHWSSPGECEKVPDTFGDVVTVRDGMQACIKGRFLGPDRMTLQFSSPAQTGVLQIDIMRKDADNTVTWTGKFGAGGSTAVESYPGVTLALGQTFELSVYIYTDSMIFSLHTFSSLQNMQFGSGGSPPDLPSITNVSFTDAHITFTSYSATCEFYNNI